MIANEFSFLLFEFHSCAIPPIYIVVFREESEWIPNGHIFVDSLSIPRRNSTGKMRRYFIDFERRIHVEIMKSIQRGKFNVDPTFKVMKYRCVLHVDFSMPFRRQIDVTSVLATISILSFSALGTYSKATLV